ncbi:metal-dependent hydrolase [Olivibacter sitiensis]|uniref:metal-dependent hydrolase n=1 Tax=Olivibacter sitiensis TaxID=376470 RepID=UPI0004030E11|nr:metal-dependent hydrolase [Olivibacter sitiensis]
MTTPNHLAGGLVFTGICASLWNVNVFQAPAYLVITAVASLLPDIDHTRSIIGKLCYPIARMIAKKYSHRTITHSLLFLLASTLAFHLANRYFIHLPSATLIFFFSVLSHFILDMVTIQGIPFFYPFIKNPCVIPAKPEYRFKATDIKAEGIAFFVFTLMLFTFQDLFANGFWMQLNNAFSDLKHVAAEFRNNQNFIQLEYDYSHFQERNQGTAIVVTASDKNAVLYQDGTFISLATDVDGITIHDFKVSKTQIPKETQIVNFENIKIDSLNSILNGHFITNAVIFASENATAIIDGKPSANTYFSFQNQYGIIFQETDKQATRPNQLEILRLQREIEIEENQIQQENKKYENMKTELQNLQQNLKNAKNPYQEDHLRNQIINLAKQLDSYRPKSNTQLLKQKEKLAQLSKPTVPNPTHYTGQITFLIIQ